MTQRRYENRRYRYYVSVSGRDMPNKFACFAVWCRHWLRAKKVGRLVAERAGHVVGRVGVSLCEGEKSVGKHQLKLLPFYGQRV
jgi:hypothetical protein